MEGRMLRPKIFWLIIYYRPFTLNPKLNPHCSTVGKNHGRTRVTLGSWGRLRKLWGRRTLLTRKEVFKLNWLRLGTARFAAWLHKTGRLESATCARGCGVPKTNGTRATSLHTRVYRFATIFEIDFGICIIDDILMFNFQMSIIKIFIAC